ncbi:hypothetical protein V6N13_038324 [Hibiscus sabdariffa]
MAMEMTRRMVLFGVWTKSVHQHKIRVEIKAIQTKLENISKTLPAYEIPPGDGAESSSVSSMQQRLRTFSHVEKEGVVSLEVSTKTWLVF